MNQDQIKSIVVKVLTVALWYAVGKGWLSEAQSASIAVDGAALLMAAYSIFSSIRTHADK